MTKIEFELFGLQLLEPMALIMNWLIAAQCIVYFSVLSKFQENEFLKYWKGFFLLFGISTFFGGLSHALFNYTGLLGKIPGWGLAVLAISSVQLTVTHEKKSEVPSWVRPAIYLQLAIVASLLLFKFQFLWVTIHTAIGLVVFLGAWSVTGFRRGRREFAFYIWGIVSIVLSLPFLLFKIDLHDWFNRHDISHVFMIITLHLFYLGAKNTD